MMTPFSSGLLTPKTFRESSELVQLKANTWLSFLDLLTPRAWLITSQPRREDHSTQHPHPCTQTINSEERLLLF